MTGAVLWLAVAAAAPSPPSSGLGDVEELQRLLQPGNCAAVLAARGYRDAHGAALEKVARRDLAAQVEKRIDDAVARLRCDEKPATPPGAESAAASPAAMSGSSTQKPTAGAYQSHAHHPRPAAPLATAPSPASSSGHHPQTPAPRTATSAASQRAGETAALQDALGLEKTIKDACASKAAPPDAARCHEELGIARREVAERQLDALLSMNPISAEWQELRPKLEIRAADSLETSAVLDAVEDRVASGELTADDAAEILGKPVETLALARELAKPVNGAAFVKFKDAVNRRQSGAFPAGPLDWTGIFGVLRKLSQEVVREAVLSAGAWNPTTSLRRDELAVVLLGAPDVFPEVGGFVEGLVPWLRLLSPNANEEHRPTDDGTHTAHLERFALERCEAICGLADDESTPPADASQGEKEILGWLSAGTGGAPVMGVLVVTVTAGAAHAAWRVRRAGAHFDKGQADTRFALGYDRAARAAMQTEGDAFAREILVTRGLFPELARWMKPLPPPPPPEGASPWTAALFAGTPFIVDARASNLRAAVPSAVEIGFLVVAGIFAGYAVHNRNLYTDGTYRSSQPANEAIAWTGAMLGGVLLTRAVSGFSYWHWSGAQGSEGLR